MLYASLFWFHADGCRGLDKLEKPCRHLCKRAALPWKGGVKGVSLPESECQPLVISAHLHEAVEGLVDHGDQHTVHQEALQTAQPALVGNELCDAVQRRDRAAVTLTATGLVPFLPKPYLP